MPVDTRELLHILAEICDENNIKVCITESFKGALLTFFTTGIGGLLLGPAGLAIGGIVGGGIAAATGQGKFRSASEILLGLPESKKQSLKQRIELAFRDFGAGDIIMIINLIATSGSLRNLALKEVKGFLAKDLNLVIQ